MVTLIYCAGKNATFAGIAAAAGFKLGAQVPCTVYNDLYFCDQDWKQPNREAYMAALAKYRPVMATVLDWEREEQLGEVLSWAEEAAQHTERVLIVPKVQGGIGRLPRRVGGREVMLAFSVPTRFGGTELPLWEFAGWPIHLLGGSPQSQMRHAIHLDAIADVVSADGNMAQLQANSCRFWSARPGPKGHWWQLSDVGDTNRERGARERAFKRSCENIMRAWRSLTVDY